MAYFFNFIRLSRADISRGNVDVLFTSPEAILGDYGRSVIASRAYKDGVCLIALDEAHCVIEW